MLKLTQLRPRFSLGFLLLFTGFVAVYLASQPENIARFETDYRQPRIIRVLVATSEIGPKEQLEGKVEYEEWPGDKAPLGLILDADDVKGFVALKRFYKGEAIVKSKLIAE